MKFVCFFLILAAGCSAFIPIAQQPRTSATTLEALKSSRKAFLTKFAGSIATMAATATVPSPAVAKDQYSLDVVETKTEKPKNEKSGGGANLVGGALAGGFALSLPFFLPNLMRMSGINNAKLDD